MSATTHTGVSDRSSWLLRIAIVLLLIVLIGSYLYYRSQSKVVNLLQMNALQGQRIEEYNRLAEQVRGFNQQFGARYGKISTIENIGAANSDLDKIKAEPNLPSSVDSLITDFGATLDHVNYLGDKIAKLEKSLGAPHKVKSNENHADIAMDYLTHEAGLPPDEAKRILKRTALIWELEPGNAVYNLYYDGVFLTTVTQGTAKSSPLVTQRRAHEATARKFADLEAQLNKARTPQDSTSKDTTGGK